MPLRFPAEYSVLVEFLRSPRHLISLLKEEDRRELPYPDIQRVFPEKFGVALEEALDYLKSLDYSVPKILNRISGRLFTICGGFPKVNTENLEFFHYLTTSIDTNLLLVASLFEEMRWRDRKDWPALLNRLARCELEFDSEISRRISEISDLHIHLGGSLRFTYALHLLLVNFQKLNIERLPIDPVVDQLALQLQIVPPKRAVSEVLFLTSLVERLLALFLKGRLHEEEKRFLETIKPCLNELHFGPLRELFSQEKSLLPNLRTTSYRAGNSLEPKLLLEGLLEPLSNAEKILLDASSQAFNEGSILVGDRFFLMALFFLYQKLPSQDYRKNLIEAYMILRNLLKSLLVQQHRRADFLYFSSFSGSSLKRTRTSADYYLIAESFKSLFPHPVKLKVEGRITPAKTVKELRQQVINYYRAFRETCKNVKLKVTFHFIKRKSAPPKDNDDNWVRWKKLRKEVWKQSLAIDELLKTYGHSPLLGKKKPTLWDVVSGIDAASKEFYAPAEVFAKAYRYLKMGVFCSDSVKHNLSYTFHAGEEFKSIISGIRRVYEAIEFLNFKEGDRIGHGVSLGISTETFSKYRENSCVLSYQELLDNAAFTYYTLSRLRGDFPQKYQILTRCSEVINSILRRLTDGRTAYSHNDYIESWLLRKNCPLTLKMLQRAEETGFEDFIEKLIEEPELIVEKSPLSMREVKSAVPDAFNRGILSGGSLNLKAWELYWLYNTSPKWFKKAREFCEETFEVPPEVVEVIQEEMLELIRTKGIVLEALITSNLLITPIDRAEEHPIFKFLEKGVRVVLGSDNPGIQETTILFEVELLYQKLKEKYGSKRAISTIKELLEEGQVVFEK